MKSKTNRFGSSLEGLLHSLYCFSSGDEFEAGGMRFRVSDSAKHENKKRISTEQKNSMSQRNLIEGNPVLVVVDIQNGDPPQAGVTPIPHMQSDGSWVTNATKLIQGARDANVPVVFIQEAHRRDLIDFGRELDGAEGVHLLEGDHGTEIRSEIGMTEDDYFIKKRRYSCFFGTDFELLMKGLHANTLIFIGGLTDVCVHYSFVDGHQNDYFCRVVEDSVTGSSLDSHKASLNAMEYLQTGARRNTAEVLQTFQQRAEDLGVAESLGEPQSVLR